MAESTDEPIESADEPIDLIESVDEPIEVPPEHRNRRHAAAERAVRAHEHAAAVHDATAAFMREHDKPEKAVEHERAAEAARQLASEARTRAEEHLDEPSGEKL